jgi:hypothetical protein
MSVFAAPPERPPYGLKATVAGVILVTRSLRVTGLKTFAPNVTVAFPDVIAVATVMALPRLIAAVRAIVRFPASSVVAWRSCCRAIHA